VREGEALVTQAFHYDDIPLWMLE